MTAVSGSTVLVVDADPDAVQIIASCLGGEGFHIETAVNGRAALEKAQQARPSLVLLDRVLPELDGLEVCRRLRRDSGLPIIFVTAQSDDADKVAAFEVGADDYIIKPFSPRELVARVKAVLRRCDAVRKPSRVLRFVDLTVDQDRREFRIGDRVVELRPKEFDLLAMLAESPSDVVDRQRLLQVVWGYEYYGDSRTIDVHVTWLREKLTSSQARIQTVWGVGYKLIPADQATARSAGRKSRPVGDAGLDSAGLLQLPNVTTGR